MMKEEVISVELFVTRIGQRIYFQVPLPRDAKSIIGLEYGAIKDYAVEFGGPVELIGPQGDPFLRLASNRIIGRLNLQVAGCENSFFQGNLAEDRNIKYGEGITAVLWSPQLFTHGRKREEIELSVNSDTTIIEGVFVDSGDQYYEELTYQLHLYLWIEKNVA